MLFHSIIAFFYTVPGKIILLGTVIMDSALALAVADPSNNRDWMIVAITGNVTAVLIAAFTGWVQWKIAATVAEHKKISESNAAQIAVVAKLPEKVEEYTKNVDGKMTELMKLTREAEHAKGKEQERLEEVGRQGAAALVQQAALVPAPVIVKNAEDDPANVKQAK